MENTHKNILVIISDLSQPINFPSIATTRRYRIQYRRPGSTFLSSIFVSSPASSYTVPRLEFQTEYNFTIRAEVRFSYCFFTLSGQPSEAVSAMPAETGTAYPFCLA